MLFIGMPTYQIINGAPLLGILIMSAIMVPIIAFTLNIFFGTSYTIIDQNELIVKCGMIYHSTVPISSIKSIRKTRNPISAPAPSMDRIELHYGKWDSVILSPRDKRNFINELQKINPNIKTEIFSRPAMPRGIKY